MAIDWKKVRRDYERGKLSFKELAKRHRCHCSTIEKRVKKEGWTRIDTHEGAKTQENGRTDSPESLLNDHRRLWKGVKRKLANGLKDDNVEKLKVAKTACDVLSSVVKGEKEVWGLEDDNYGKVLNDTVELTEEMERVTIPPCTEAPVDGKKTLSRGSCGEKERKD